MEKSLAPIVINKPSDYTEVLSEKLNNLTIKLPELTSIDPLDYFSRFLGISEMILKHLSGKDLLTASEVTPSWYNFIASSKVLMKKTGVVFDRDFDYNEDDLVRISDVNPIWYKFFDKIIDEQKVFLGKCATHSEDCNLLKNSSRLYQNIEIRRRFVNIKDENGNRREVGDYMTNLELDVFCSKAHEWKNVSLENVYFRKKLDLWKLLSSIQTSVESIFVRDYGLLSLEDPTSEIEYFEALKLPKLKKFTVRLHENSSIGDTLATFLLNSVAIEELVLIDFPGKVDKDILTKMLENFEKLTSLTLYSSNISQLFEEDSWEKFQFKLNFLEIIFRTDLDIGTNLPKFLKSQSDYLEELAIEGNDVNIETFDVIMKMPKLKQLLLGFSFESFSVNAPTKISTSITELILYGRPSADSLNFMLDSMPKLKKLKLRSNMIDDEILKMLKSLKKKFEKLRFYKFEGSTNIKEAQEIVTEENPTN